MNSTRFYKIVIIILLVINLGWIAVTLIMRGIVVPGMIRGKAPDYLVRELRMNRGQRHIFGGMRGEHLRAMRHLMVQDRILHERFFDQLFENKPDTGRILRIADSIATLRKQMDLLTFDHFSKLQKVLNKGQQERFRRVFSDALEQVMPPVPDAPPIPDAPPSPPSPREVRK